MRHFDAVILLAAVLLSTGCTTENAQQDDKSPANHQQEMQSTPVASTGNIQQRDESQEGIRNISVTEFNKRRLSSPENVIVIDVRTPAETADGVVPGAIKMEYGSNNFEEELATLDKSKDYLVYCAAGARSGKTARIMQDMGFENVYNLDTGYEGWLEAESKDR